MDAWASDISMLDKNNVEPVKNPGRHSQVKTDLTVRRTWLLGSVGGGGIHGVDDDQLPPGVWPLRLQ